jgi:hypothetical protein
MKNALYQGDGRGTADSPSQKTVLRLLSVLVNCDIDINDRKKVRTTQQVIEFIKISRFLNIVIEVIISYAFQQ